MKLEIGRGNEANVMDMFGNVVEIGVREDGAIIIGVANDGRNTANDTSVLKQEVVIAFSAEQTTALAKQLLQLQP